jgi:hypothetical protein
MNYNKLISWSAVVALTGFIMSGPVAFIIVKLLKPQPSWTSAAVFAANYNIIQDLPYYFGFFLIGGMLMLVAGHYLNGKANDDKIQFQLLLAFACTIIFCAMISFNYICQTTFVRNLALYYRQEHDAAISMFSMSNPMSFCWANEIWGYAVLGIATWLLAGYYRNKSNFTRALLIANGIISIISVIWMIIDVNWVMTTAGLISYFLWNLLMIILMISIYLFSLDKKNVYERK